jgi:hypothetical protein
MQIGLRPLSALDHLSTAAIEGPADQRGLMVAGIGTILLFFFY